MVALSVPVATQSQIAVDLDIEPLSPRPVVGLDLSLTSPGWATTDSRGGFRTGTWKAGARRDHTRFVHYLRAIDELVHTAELVVLEGPAYGSQGTRQSGHHERAGLWWLVAHELWKHGIPYAVAPPQAVKKYVTGKGNAGKDVVMREVARRFPAFSGGEDEADALGLCALGAAHVGRPLVELPAVNRQALTSVAWPEVVS